jgi:uncharacterized protein (TIGR03435 family)
MVHGPHKRCIFAAVIAFVFAAAIAASVSIQVRAQGPEQDWEQAAGGKQQFEVASVRENRSGGGSYSNFELTGGTTAFWVMAKGDPLGPSGNLFSAKNIPLWHYIVFAYRLNGTEELALRFDYFRGTNLHVPERVRNGRYDIQARAPGPATKDQMRLMMQSLLAERFNLKVHREKREAPVFGLVEARPGKMGPQMEAHAASDDCAKENLPDAASNTSSSAQVLSALPIPCGWIAHLPASAAGAHRFGGRDVTLQMLAESLPTQTGLVTLPRPVVDESGLKGGYDFWMEWTPEDTRDVPDNSESGGTFREALKNQLGLKLVPGKGSVEVLVIDHVEQPTEN